MLTTSGTSLKQSGTNTAKGYEMLNFRKIIFMFLCIFLSILARVTCYSSLYKNINIILYIPYTLVHGLVEIVCTKNKLGVSAY